MLRGEYLDFRVPKQLPNTQKKRSLPTSTTPRSRAPAGEAAKVLKEVDAFLEATQDATHLISKEIDRAVAGRNEVFDDGIRRVEHSSKIITAILRYTGHTAAEIVKVQTASAIASKASHSYRWSFRS